MKSLVMKVYVNGIVELVVAYGHGVVAQQFHSPEIGFRILPIRFGNPGIDISGMNQNPRRVGLVVEISGCGLLTILIPLVSAVEELHSDIGLPVAGEDPTAP